MNFARLLGCLCFGLLALEASAVAPTASFSLSSERIMGQTLTVTVNVGDSDGNYSYANLWVNTPNRGWVAIKADNSAVVSNQLLAANTVAATAGQVTRTFAFTPTDGTGSYTFALTAVDTLGSQTSAASQTITVVANQAPTASFSLSSERIMGQTVTVTLNVGDPNGNYSFANLWVNTSNRGWVAIKADSSTVVSNQLLAANTVAATAGQVTRTFAFTPTDGTGSYTFALTAVDTLGLQTSAASQTITVVANQAPTASFSLSSERIMGQTLTVTVNVGDPNNNYAYANLWVNTPNRGWVAIKADNSTVVSNQLLVANTVAATAGTFARTFAFTPTDGTGSYTFALTAVDTLGLQTSAASQTITVVANQAPTASFSLSSERVMGQTLTVTVNVGDPNGNYSFANLWVNTPNRGWVAIKADNSTVVSNQLLAANTVAATAGTFARTFAFTPTDGLGSYTFALTAVDAFGLQTSAASQTITIIAVPPVITVQPLSTVKALGQTLALTVVATGTPTPTYQWKRNGLALANGGAVSGATSATLTITGVSPVRESGWYQVVVSNASGSITSAVAFVNIAVNPSQLVSWGRNNYGQATVPAGLTDIAGITAGTSHSAVLKSDGTVAAWGSNVYNECILPASVTTAGSNIVAVAASSWSYHTLALKSNGTVVAWGAGTTNSTSNLEYGQSIIPAGLTNVVAVSPGYLHSLALKSDGTVVAWGRNIENQATVPAGLTNVVAISAGAYHSLALKSDGTVVAWGYNAFGQGAALAGLTNVTTISAGNYHNLALRSNGTVAAWGYGDALNPAYGQAIVPAGTTNVVGIAAGGYHSGLFKADGSIVTWGLGDPANASFGQATLPPSLGSIVGLAGGNYHTLALRNAASDLFSYAPVLTFDAIAMPTARQIVAVGQSTNLKANATGYPAPSFQWKRNGKAIAGATAATYNIAGALPVRDNGWYQVTATNASGVSTSTVTFVNVAISPAQILGSGSNGYLQLTIPTGATDGGGTVSVMTGEMHSVALKSNGTVVAWGNNTVGQTAVPGGLSGIVAISANQGSHTLALKSDGTVYAWGLGDPTHAGHGQATVPAALTNVATANIVSVAAGGHHSLALKTDGTVVAWGAGLTNPQTGANYGQSIVPAGLANAATANVVALIAGDLHSVALKADGTVVAWGAGTTNTGVNNNFGQSIVPAALQNAATANIVAIAAGAFHTLALKADGTVVGWGMGTTNTDVGNSTGNNQGQALPPAVLTNPATANVVALAAGMWFSLALKSDGTVVGWGYNGNGETQTAGLNNIVAIAATFYHNLKLRNAATGNLPVITVQPRGDGVLAGTTLTFDIGADGTSTFQWQVNGTDIPGATGESYTTPPTIPQNDGDIYTVEVTNDVGTITSQPAELIVAPGDPAQTISFIQPTTPQTYGTAPIALSATATSLLPVTFSVLSGPATVSGSTLTITGAGSVQVRATQPGYTNTEGQLYYNAATPVDRTIVVNKKALTITAVSTSRPYGVANPSFTASVAGLVNGDPAAVIGGTPAFSTPATVSSSPGSYAIVPSLGSLAATNYSFGAFINGTLTINKATPVITWASPTAITFGTALSPTQLNATANVPGSFVYLPAAGTVLAAGSQPLSVTFTPTDTTNYNGATAQQTLTVNPAIAPTFTLHPVTQTVNVGAAVTLTSAASGTPAPSYQWQKNNSPIGGATGSSYTIASAAPGDAGTYKVVVTNSGGSATSNAAILTVNSAPAASFALSSERIIGQTITATVTVGDPDGNYSFANLWVNTPGRGWVAIKADGSAVVSSQLLAANTVAATAGTFARTFAFTPTDGAGSYTFALTAVDAGGLQTNASNQAITVTANQAPTASFSLSAERTIGQTITATVTVGDPDGNYSFANLWVNTPGRGWVAIKADNSAVVSSQLLAANTVAATAGTYARTFAFTPTDGSGNYTFALTAVDALGLQTNASNQTIAITANQAPTASFSLSAERTIGQTITATVTVGDPDGNYSFANLWVNTPGRGWLAIKADNSAVVSNQLLAANTVAATAGTYARTFAFTPTDGAGSYTFALTAVDAMGLQTNASSQTITVTAANQAPTASFSLSSERMIGQAITATVTVGDPDGNYSFANLWVNTPGRGWVAIKADSSAVVSSQLLAANTVAATAGTYARTFAFTPTDGAGTYTFALTAVDALGLQASASQTITVTANQAPTASFSLSSERNIGQTITATVTVGDPDGNYSFANLWVNTPGRGWLAIKADNNAVVSSQLLAANTVAATAGTFARTFAFTPTDGPGSYIFALTAVDTLGLQASASQTITVNPLVLFADDFSTVLNTTNWVQQPDDSSGVSTWVSSAGALTGYYPLSLSAATNTQSFLLLGNARQPSGDWRASFDFTWVTDLSDGTFSSAIADFGLWLNTSAKLNISAGYGGVGASSAARSTINVNVQSWNGTSWSSLSSAAVNLNWTPASVNTATLEKHGTVYHLLINNVEVLRFTDSVLQGQGKLGLHAFGTRTVDDFLLEQL